MCNGLQIGSNPVRRFTAARTIAVRRDTARHIGRFGEVDTHRQAHMHQQDKGCKVQRQDAMERMSLSDQVYKCR
jgi:hypothetical protein